MDDLIKRQDAITAYCEHECGIKGMTRENCGATDCGTIFDDIPSAQQWISCSERLPEENYWTGGGRQFSDIMLVTCVHHANDNEHFIDMAETVDGAWRFIREKNEGYGFLPDCCEVIAWMPLPEPYKGEET